MIQIQTFTVNYFGENTYLLFDETKEAAIIDCGCMNPQECKQIESFITQHELIVKHHLCTHIHVDHLLGAEFIHNKYGLWPETTSQDIKTLPPISEQAKVFGLPIVVHDICITTQLETDGEIHFGKSLLKILAVPGHSPGSIAFYDAESHSVFTGDALFAGSIGRTDLWGGNYDQLIHSIQTELLTLPNDTIIYPGHGQTSSVAFEKSNNPYI